MDRSQLLLLGLPIFLLFSDILNLFTVSPPPPKPTQHVHKIQSNHNHLLQQPQPQSQPLQFPTQKSSDVIGGAGGLTGIGNTVNIDFCASCSYRGTAMTMKNMLESQYPGINIVLANYPPSFPKRLLSKVVPVVQFGIIGLITAGEHIFPRLGFAVPPPWYYSLRANKFGSIASTWLFGNFIQSFLQSSGAFEVYFNGELVFSKLSENRFPGEIELRDLVGQKLAITRTVQ
ncbi:selT-like protein [Ricinus communis]|uniref:Selenoprotein T, putative n=1 Tax=Ricinus communis TaxID=3988 RepID=B9T1J6_RICCO|nr:selT-like protein [Ricinus communis]EEF30277.1 Selenoprotein T precursor, putative [Ricinus communis]|eukprot:XP_002532115.1 selT-like protein [Ricinus communis]